MSCLLTDACLLYLVQPIEVARPTYISICQYGIIGAGSDTCLNDWQQECSVED